MFLQAEMAHSYALDNNSWPRSYITQPKEGVRQGGMKTKQNHFSTGPYNVLSDIGVLSRLKRSFLFV